MKWAMKMMSNYKNNQIYWRLKIWIQKLRKFRIKIMMKLK